MVKPLLLSALLFISLHFSSAFAATGRAEFVRLEPVAEQATEQLVLLIGDKPAMVAARYLDRTPPPWAIHEALSVETTASLRKNGVNVVRSASHPATEALSAKTSIFTAGDARLAKEAGCEILVAVEIQVLRGKPRAKFTLWPTERGKKLGDVAIDLPPEGFDLLANVPELNQKVVQFGKQGVNRRISDGSSWDFGVAALEAAGAERSGVYTWGRELDAHEPLMPGDFLQLEHVRIEHANGAFTFEHHTSIVEEVRPDSLIVLHQNVRPHGQIVHRATFPAASAMVGTMRAYRPWSGESPLPPVSPRRRAPAEPVRQGKTIDLLATLDPQLDSVRGIWWRNGRALQMNGETYATLQVPVAPPASYTLRMKAVRLGGDDMLGIGVVAGGRQAMVAIDGYEGTKTGLSTLDGRNNEDNETTHDGRILQEQVPVDFVVQVRPDSVKFAANGQIIFEWQGDPARLGMNERYPVPQADRLFLASWNSSFQILEYTLTEDEGGQASKEAPRPASASVSSDPPAATAPAKPAPAEIDPFELR